jgi:hypothetical protein
LEIRPEVGQAASFQQTSTEAEEKALNTIWKVEIPVEDEIKLQMPEGAEILDVQTQHETPCLWFACNPANKLVERHFRLIGTGHHYYDYEQMKYIGTFQITNLTLGTFVGHVFEVDGTPV